MTQEQKYNLALALISQGVTNLNDVQNFIDGLDLNHEKVSAKGSAWVGSEDKSDGGIHFDKEVKMTISCPKEHHLNILNLVQKYSLDKGLGEVEIEKSWVI
ncbi:hypothetical protein [Acinetobacter pollinis]|uniref:hypothetical protein n=1 Tax=Acinetobacter pollinis TaxID=2605270 RepID=UPI0018A2D4C0|nr:hypothetical protein [Acinetobacter pollinis]MBF7691565.1 hypothetical protein [Acinetobacter pollinis]MBF7699253.1 hypothetical protein [Acinetobacter pollinis]